MNSGLYHPGAEVGSHFGRHVGPILRIFLKNAIKWLSRACFDDMEQTLLPLLLRNIEKTAFCSMGLAISGADHYKAS